MQINRLPSDGVHTQTFDPQVEIGGETPQSNQLVCLFYE